ncbi:MAG: hypothetical protein ACRD3E_12310 [Terriglobales bacterium]
MTETKKLISVVMAAFILTGTIARAQMAKLGDGPAVTGNPDKTAPLPRTIPKISPDAIKPPSLSLSPAVVMTNGSFGQSITQTLMLTNGTSRPMAFDMVAEDAVVRDGKRVFVAAGEMPGSIAATAVFSTPMVLVQPFSNATVDVRFTVPQGTNVRAVVALFRGTDKIPSGRGAVSMTASLGTLITFNMSNQIHVAADPLTTIGQTDVTNAVIGDWVTNTGNEPVIPAGMVAVLDSTGALVSKAELPAQRLLPGERLEFKAECPTALPPGSYRVLASYEFEGQTITKTGELTVR